MNSPLPHVVIATTPGRRARLDLCLNALRQSTVPFVLVVYENTEGGCAPALLRALEGITGELFILNDDMIVEPECLERLRDAFRQKPSFQYGGGVVQPDGNYHPNGEIATAPYLDRGTLWNVLSRGYKHYFWDMELVLNSRKHGNYLHVPQAKLDHQHVTKGFPDDETYRLTNLNWVHDEAIFKAREAAGFPDC